jgi:hypothetical protein
VNAALAWGTGALLALSAAAAQAAPEHSDAAVAEPLPALRARFMRRIDEEGFRVCAPPAIRAVEGPVPARYDATTDALAVGAAAAAADAATRWAFVHELGHWWQACRGQGRPGAYAAASGADRIALAFWREQDPRFAAAVVEQARRDLLTPPRELPAGASPEQYLDASPPLACDPATCRWLEARMIVELAGETPAPSFHKSLSQPLYPY